MQRYIVRKIGSNKGKPRVYLQIQALEIAGFYAGKTYNRVIDATEKRLTLNVEENGSYVVSRKEKDGHICPIIDINSCDALSQFDGMEVIRIVIEINKITILPLASEVKRAKRLDRMREHIHAGELVTAGVSFGGGVLDHAAHAGLKSAGLNATLAMANDIDEDMLEHAIGHNDTILPGTSILAAPMQELVQDDAAMSRLKPVDVLCLGIPCSGASVAGKSKRSLAMMENHPTIGHLAAAALMIINRIQPGVLLLENVVPYSETASAQIIRQQLRDSGYDTQEIVLNAQDFGSLENRKRWFLVASTRGIDIDLAGLVPTLRQVHTMSEVLEPVALDDESWRTYEHLKTKEMRDALKGSSFAMQVLSPEDTSCPVIRRGYAKNGSSDPLLQHPTNPDLLRALTVTEHGKVKQVPARLAQDMTKTDGHAMLGQGVCYGTVHALFFRIGQCLVNWSLTSSTSMIQPMAYDLRLATG